MTASSIATAHLRGFRSFVLLLARDCRSTICRAARTPTRARRAFHDGGATLLSDASHFEGAITVARGPRVARLFDDRFARVFPDRILRVEAGLFGCLPAPCGPTIERYGSAQAWPWDRYETDS
jgi:hypothetical protein